MIETIGAAWGFLGIVALLTTAIYRLFPIAVKAYDYAFMWYHWLFLGFIIIFMMWVKGYLVFQKRFSPRVAARAKYLKDHPVLLNSIFAPFFCMGYFHTSRKRQLISISLTSAIVVLIIFMKKLSQPWRGIVNSGVVIGLDWGIVSLLIFGFKAFFTTDFDYSSEVE